MLETADEDTAEIIKAKYSGTRFMDMGAANLQTSAKLILADLKLITGGNIPPGNTFERLTQLLAESLRSDYPTFTVPEIILAFKRKSAKIPLYGKDISLSFIHNILELYLPERQNAREHEEKVDNAMVTEKKISAENLERLTRENLQKCYQHYYSTGFINNSFSKYDFEQLVKDGFIEENLQEDFLLAGLKALKGKYKRFIESTKKKGNDAESISGVVEKRNWEEKMAVLNDIENEMRSEAVKFGFKYAKKNNVKSFY